MSCRTACHRPPPEPPSAYTKTDNVIHLTVSRTYPPPLPAVASKGPHPLAWCALLSGTCSFLIGAGIWWAYPAIARFGQFLSGVPTLLFG